ncbi:SIS domain-containing protein [Methanosphaera cuniculi]|uniref:Glucosamine--fructose-6-phosphate aminotransferase n=1 Tax=Methanosphaera cuniculi TaxID=1077256 RepID=A0A2A2HCV8_9EURY|nr:SIS domain-containing protein [Methanosphaera cuniculi]PAV07074.1 glucosamine--fructose-6-phosphate aminotransferase [Methanosphaera cuniculi]PWL07588.1 glutamine--fructose-6-phosphate aminotransferase [Methanosphaera cuniculi]
MEYEMYQEILDQPISLERTISTEKEHMLQLSEQFSKFDKIFLIGCGSSISTCYTIRDAMKSISNINIDVQTGFDFVDHQYLEDNSNYGVILTSQSGETSDTLAALRKAKKHNIKTLSITNVEDSSMAKEADDTIITKCKEEIAILGTKTYVTQLISLYYIFFNMIDSKRAKDIIKQLDEIPSIMEELIKTTEESSKKIAEENKDVDLFYCMGSGLNFGLSYKLAMTMFMEGALKHACPVYSGEFRHGLIERVEEGVTVVFIKSGDDWDEVTQRAINFCKDLGVNTVIFDLQNYYDIDPLLTPFILIIPLEWFIYHLAIYNDEDPGSTRHIGKVRY